MKHINEITGAIINNSIKIHTRFGPGLLESVYERILARELEEQGFLVEQQKSASFSYKGMEFENCFRVDLLVDKRVLVELKSVEHLLPVHFKQALSYVRLLNVQVGLLLNFGEASLTEGLHRIVNNYQPTEN